MDTTSGKVGYGMGEDDTLNNVMTLTMTREMFFNVYAAISAVKNEMTVKAIQRHDSTLAALALHHNDFCVRFHEMYLTMTTEEASVMTMRHLLGIHE